MCSIAFPPESTNTTAPSTNGDLATARAARNKRNAQHSTGPRTKAGKARSAQNARTHGLTSTLPPTQVPVPDPTAQLSFTTLTQELKEEHRPTTPTQTVLIEELALVIWKLQYLPRVEHRLFNTPLADDRPQTPEHPPQRRPLFANVKLQHLGKQQNPDGRRQHRQSVRQLGGHRKLANFLDGGSMLQREQAYARHDKREHGRQVYPYGVGDAQLK